MAHVKLREIAEARGWTAAKLARRADLGYTTVLRLWNEEGADPQLGTLAAIARVLGVKVVDLIFEEPDAAQFDGHKERREPMQAFS